MAPSTSQIRVLHVDDDPDFGSLTAEYLEREGPHFTVETVSTAATALDRMAKTPIDCIVSDHDMPGLTGIDLLERVRDEYPDLPFILFTGKGSEAVASQAISAGVTDYLQKAPGSDQFTLLANRITNAVDQYRTEQELETVRRRMIFALEATNSIVFEVELATQTEHHHGPFEALYGVSPERISTSEDFNTLCVHPEDRDRINQYQRAETFDTLGERVEYEFRTNPANGDVRWMRSVAYIETGPNGTPERLIGLNTDITHSK